MTFRGLEPAIPLIYGQIMYHRAIPVLPKEVELRALCGGEVVVTELCAFAFPVTLGGLKDHIKEIQRCRRLILIACGTSYHAGVAVSAVL